MTIDGGGSVVSSATASSIIEKGGTFDAVSLYSGITGSITASLSRVRGSTLEQMGTVGLSGEQYKRDTTLSGWTVDVAVGDILNVAWGGTIDAVQRVVLTILRSS